VKSCIDLPYRNEAPLSSNLSTIGFTPESASHAVCLLAVWIAPTTTLLSTVLCASSLRPIRLFFWAVIPKHPYQKKRSLLYQYKRSRVNSMTPYLTPHFACESSVWRRRPLSISQRSPHFQAIGPPHLQPHTSVSELVTCDKAQFCTDSEYLYRHHAVPCGQPWIA
jgi:hypothetical protein